MIVPDVDLKTDPELLRNIALVIPRSMSDEEKRQQRISFIFGQMDGLITKERIAEILNQQERGTQ